MFRLLLTGSRDWLDPNAIAAELTHYAMAEGGLILVHGACPRGADAMGDAIARRLGCQIERHPADWQRYGKRAGYVRNAKMVEAGADLCLAFISNNSKGASMCADLAEKAGIPTRRIPASG